MSMDRVRRAEVELKCAIEEEQREAASKAVGGTAAAGMGAPAENLVNTKKAEDSAKSRIQRIVSEARSTLIFQLHRLQEFERELRWTSDSECELAAKIIDALPTTRY